MMKKIGKVQGGELLLRSTSLKEYGLLIGDSEKITQSIYWNTKLDMLCALEQIMEILKES